MTMKKISTSHFIPSPISISIVCFMSLISNNSKMTFTNWTSVFRLSDPDNKILFESWQQDKKRRFWYLKWLHIKHNHCFYVKYFFNHLQSSLPLSNFNKYSFLTRVRCCKFVIFFGQTPRKTFRWYQNTILKKKPWYE